MNAELFIVSLTIISLLIVCNILGVMVLLYPSLSKRIFGEDKKAVKADIPLNFNRNIKVKLTEEGINHYVIYHNSTMPLSKIYVTKEAVKQSVDKYGYTIFQFHNFINVYGKAPKELDEYCEMNFELVN